MNSTNPATGEVIATFEEQTEDEVDDTLDEATTAFKSWCRRPIEERESLLSDVADVLRSNVDEYARVMTDEMGKPIGEAESEVEKCAWVCDYYAERAAEHLQDERIGTVPGAETYVSYEPLGTVLAIMPWNFPFWQLFRFAAPHLTAGNVGILKHASNVQGCALTMESIFEEAGYPEGVFSSLRISSSRVDDVIQDDRIEAVTLTGSTGAGRAVAETSGRELKKTVLELGGSDPFVVLDDADLDRAASVGASARTLNSGQSCIAAKRFIVHEDVADEFLDRFVDEMASLSVGDPTNPDTDIGPQAREDLMAELHDQVERSVEIGANCVLGGEPLEEEGYYYPPTVLTDVPPEAPAATEELFGPVAAVYEVPDESAAIRRANDTQFGLGASVWTNDRDRGRRLATDIRAGNVFVNQLVKSDPRVPFGGIKDSGYGSELSWHGIREFTNEKTVWIE